MHIAPDTIVDGRYRVLKRLGTGGMAEVWCAEDEVLGRNVALKLLGSRYAEDPEFRERFRREARAAAGLTHPNIVGIFDRAEWDGTPYIAMELVDGRTLKELVTQRGPMPVDVAVDLTEQLLKALGYAHKRGIVHRDVKPQNVIIDGEGQAKVADFGIARAVNSDMTETGAIVGTVQYLSPEQAHGQPVDQRSDLYSAGVVLYELLTGQRPLRGRGAGLDRAQTRVRAPRAAVAIAARAPAGDRVRRPARAREGPGVPVPERRRVHHRAGERAPGADPPRRAGARARRAARAGLALVALAARRCSRSWRSGWASITCSAANEVTVPNVVGREASEAADILHDEGLEVAFVNKESDDVPRDEVIDEDPEAGRGGARGHDDHAHRLRRARHRPGPGRRGPVARRGREGADRGRLQGERRGGVLGLRARGRRDLSIAAGRDARRPRAGP